MNNSCPRDTAIRNLRFLNVFYGYSPASYALAVNLLDRLIALVEVGFILLHLYLNLSL